MLCFMAGLTAACVVCLGFNYFLIWKEIRKKNKEKIIDISTVKSNKTEE